MDQMHKDNVEIELSIIKPKRYENLTMENVQQEEFIYAQKQQKLKQDSSNEMLQRQDFTKNKYQPEKLVVENMSQASVSNEQLNALKNDDSKEQEVKKEKKEEKQEEKQEVKKEVKQEEKQEVKKEEKDLNKLKMEAPVNINAGKNEAVKSIFEHEQSIRKAGKGVNLQKYIDEVKEKKGKNKKIDAITPIVEECRVLIADGKTDLKSQLTKSRKLTEAIEKVNGYLRATKRLWNDNITVENKKEDRTLREAMKMLRVQLFLEKMDLEVKEPEIDEKKLYEQQLEADALNKINGEMKAQNENENSQIAKDERLKSNLKIDEMYRHKLNETLSINNNLIAGINRSIALNTERAKELQEKLGERYGLRHKAFQRNEDYQNRLAKKVAAMRPVVYSKWLDENLENLDQNAAALNAELGKKETYFKNMNGNEYLQFEQLRNIFERNLHNPEILKDTKKEYDRVFDELTRLDEEAQTTEITDNFKRLIASQKVLLEKRLQISGEYEKLIGFNEQENKQDNMPGFKEQENMPKFKEQEKMFGDSQTASQEKQQNDQEKMKEDKKNVDTMVLLQKNYYRKLVKAVEKIEAGSDNLEKLRSGVEVLLSDNRLHNIDEFADMFFEYVSGVNNLSLFNKIKLQGGNITDFIKNTDAVRGKFFSNKGEFRRLFTSLVATGGVEELMKSAGKMSEKNNADVTEISLEEFEKLSENMPVLTNSKEIGQQLYKAIKAGDSESIKKSAKQSLLSDRPFNMEKQLNKNAAHDDSGDNINVDDSIHKIAEQLNQELLYGNQSLQEGTSYSEHETEKLSKRSIFEQTLKEYTDELKNKKYDIDKNTKEQEKNKVEKLTDRILKNFAKEDEKRAGDKLAYQQFKNDEKSEEKKKKEADLEFQRNNNEYGLQEMATEERSLKEKKLARQKQEMDGVEDYVSEFMTDVRRENVRISDKDNEIDKAFMTDEMNRISGYIDTYNNTIKKLQFEIDGLRESGAMNLSSDAGLKLSSARSALEQYRIEYLEASKLMEEMIVEANEAVLKNIVEEKYKGMQYNYVNMFYSELPDELSKQISDDISQKRVNYENADKAYQQAQQEYEEWIKKCNEQLGSLSSRCIGMNKIMDFIVENGGQNIVDLLKSIMNESSDDDAEFISELIRTLDGYDRSQAVTDDELLSFIDEHAGDIVNGINLIENKYDSLVHKKEEE